MLQGRTFGTHSLYLLLIPAQLRKCRYEQVSRFAAMAMLPSQRRGDGLCAAPLRDADGAVAALPMTKGEVIRHPGGGAGLLLLSWWNVYYCVSVVYLGTMTACHRLRGGIFSVHLHRPRMSPTPVGEIRGYAQLQPLAG